MPRHINLLDPQAKSNSPYLTVILMGVPLLLVILVTGAMAGVAKYRVSVLKHELNDISAQLQPLQQQFDQAQTGLGLDQINAELGARVAKADAQLKARKDIQGALQRGELGSSQGFSEYMRAFARRTVPGVWLTRLQLDAGGKDVTLSGNALDADSVAVLVRQLRAEPVLSGRAISTLVLAPKDWAKTDATQESAPVSSRPVPNIYAFSISSVNPVKAQTSETQNNTSDTSGPAP